MKIRYTISIFLVVFFAGSGFGQCWEQVIVEGYEDYVYTDVQFADSLRGWLACEQFETQSGKVLRTKDGGETWEEITNLSAATRYIITVINKDTVYIHPRVEKRFYYTYDGGETFDYYDLDFLYIWIDFIDSKNIWAIGRGDEVYYSKNGGKNWEVFSITQGNFSGNFQGIEVGDKNTIWAYGLGTGIYVTKNRGQTWTKMVNHPEFQGNNFILTEGDCIDSLNCFFGGHYRNNNSAERDIYHTQDGGVSWTNTKFPSKTIIEDLIFTDSLTGWFVSRDSSVFQTKDGGATWNRKVKLLGQLHDISFINNTEGWVSGGDTDQNNDPVGYLFHYKANVPECLSSLNATLNPDSLLSLFPTLTWNHLSDCVEGYELKMGTVENGDDLTPLMDIGLDTVFEVDAILPPDTMVYVTVTPYGAAGIGNTCTSFEFKTQGVSNVENISKNEITEFIIYPNPSNIETNLSIKTKKSVLVTLEIFDMKGKKVDAYSIELNHSESLNKTIKTENLLQGIYMVKLVTSSGSLTRKISVIH